MGGVVRGENEKCDEQGASEAAWVGGARVHSLIISGRVCLRTCRSPPETEPFAGDEAGPDNLYGRLLAARWHRAGPIAVLLPDYRAETQPQQAVRHHPPHQRARTL